MISGRYNLKLISAFIVVAIATVSMVACAVAPSNKLPQQPAPASNSELIIRYLTAPQQVAPLRGTEIQCVATDASGDAITYEWSATGGEIQPRKEPDTIFWLAPSKTGSYTITATVTTTKGARATRSVTVSVSSDPAQFPVIHGVTCDDCRNRIEASRFTQYTLRCEAIDPNNDELRYTWFANLGKIKGEGAYATWTVGSQSGNALITVIVTDSKGNATEGYLAVNVSCCK